LQPAKSAKASAHMKSQAGHSGGANRMTAVGSTASGAQPFHQTPMRGLMMLELESARPG
jgi:hypothetical protein